MRSSRSPSATPPKAGKRRICQAVNPSKAADTRMAKASFFNSFMMALWETIMVKPSALA